MKYEHIAILVFCVSYSVYILWLIYKAKKVLGR